MITYPDLGKVGRMGNHLFMIAATVATAREAGDSFGFPRWEHEADFPALAGSFHDSLPPGPDHWEPRFRFDPVPPYPGLRLHGFLQSEKYFAAAAGEVRRLLTPRGVPDPAAHRATAAVNVRRGDYLLLPDKHPVLPMAYYREAMARARAAGARRFLVTSDDLPWCRSQDWGPDAEVVPDMRGADQFALSIACEHHVMANSTFSWWAAWLDPNPRKTVVAPKLWFGPAYGHYATDDLIPPSWTRL